MTSLRLGAPQGSTGMKCVYGGLWVIFLLSTVFSSLSNAGLLESCPYEYGSRAFIDEKLCHYNPNPAPVGDLGNVSPDVQIPGGELTYYHNDVLGSPIAASDQYGGLLWKEEYKPFGEKVIGLDAPSTVGYTGHQFDEGTGLTYMQARYYDPVVGRFYGVDPVGFQEDSIPSFNRYAYANNNPYKYVDPDGREVVVANVAPGIGLGMAGHTFLGSGDKGYTTAVNIKGVGTGNFDHMVKNYQAAGRDVTLFVIEGEDSIVFENAVNDVLRGYDSGTYFPLGNNCSDFVVGVLNQAGIADGNTSVLGTILPAGYGNTPPSVDGSLRGEYKKNNGNGLVIDVINKKADGD